jgi:hypothetical protein
MAYTQTDIDALEAALAAGVKRVRYTDREVEYQDADQMRQQLALMRQELAAATGGRKPFIRLSTSKGFGR